MPKNTTILLIRHGEKPDSHDDVDLSPAGHSRSMAYVSYFKNLKVDGITLPKIDHIFATEDSKHSHRPRLTVTPLGTGTNLDVKAEYADEDYQKMAQHILDDKDNKYDNKNLVICWHHGKILDLANALGVETSKLPSSANWPATWDEDAFGWLLQVIFDDKGKIDYKNTKCISQNLMYNDNGKYPPSQTVSKDTVVNSDGSTTTTTTTNDSTTGTTTKSTSTS